MRVVRRSNEVRKAARARARAATRKSLRRSEVYCISLDDFGCRDMSTEWICLSCLIR